MFKNATHDPLAVPTAVQRRSVGPTHREHFAGVPWNETKNAPLREHEKYDLDQGNWGDTDPHAPYDDAGGGYPKPTGYSTGPEGSFYDGGENGPMPADNYTHTLYDHEQAAADDPLMKMLGSVPRDVAQKLRLEASTFLDAQECPDSRSETLERARRHASALTSAWTPEASQRVVQAFVSQVAELVPNRPKVAAAQSPIREDFDDQLLY